MSLTSLLDIARSAVRSRQLAIDVTANNIANANTPGYSRQQAALVQKLPNLTSAGAVGRGVTIESIQRVRNVFLDGTYRAEASRLGQFTALRDALQEIEAALAEPSDGGVAGLLDQFFGALGDLANEPTATTPRAAVRSAAEQLISRLKSTMLRLEQLREISTRSLAQAVEEINGIIPRVEGLNRQIGQAEARGRPGSAPSLRDQRDALLDRLAELIPIDTIEHPDGLVTVVAADTVLVDRSSGQPLEVQSTGNGNVALGQAGTSRAVSPQSGRLSSYLEVVNAEVPAIQQQLDGLVRALVTEVNNVHRTGQLATGQTNTNFFDPNGLTAGTIGLTPEIRQSADAIAVGSSGSPGDNSVALALAQLRTTPIGSLAGRTVGAAFADMAATIGGSVQTAQVAASSQETLVNQVSSQRSSVSGVSVEEEMISLISHQQAYNAAATIVRVADEMAAELLRIV